jgi:hypothetical protein
MSVNTFLLAELGFSKYAFKAFSCFFNNLFLAFSEVSRTSWLTKLSIYTKSSDSDGDQQLDD